MYVRKRLAESAFEERAYEKTEEKEHYRQALGLVVGQLVVTHGMRYAREVSGCTEGYGVYWKKRVRNPEIHRGTWGGRRQERFAFGGVDGDKAAQTVLYQAILTNPDAALNELTLMCRRFPGMEHVSEPWISRTIRNWGWSWTKTRPIARHKFTEENMTLWLNYARDIQDVPWTRLYFMDEVSRGMHFLFCFGCFIIFFLFFFFSLSLFRPE